MFKGRGKSLDFIGSLGGNVEFTPLEDRIGIIKKVVIIQLVKNNTTLKNQLKINRKKYD